MAAETETTETQRDERQQTEESEGPLNRWVSGAISDPGKAYQPMFWLVTIFFLFTTLFPFYWLLMVALTPQGQLQDVWFTPNG
ncbi:MAG: carbohydrate ABC transporter permease, partial [Halalkalicoccus sp.]